MNAKYLIALDLDGTFFGPNCTISQRNRIAITKAVQKGHIVVANTGRSVWSALAPLQAVPEMQTLICSNGAYEFNTSGNAINWSSTIDVKTALEIEQSIMAACPSACFGRESVSGIHFSETFIKEAGGAHTLEQGGSSARDEQVAVFKLYVRSTEISRDALFSIISPLLGSIVEVSTSGSPFLEITHTGVNKGSALEKVAAQFDIDMQNTIAFGDNNNDVPAFKVAGVAVAMGNAIPEVQALASKVAPSNINDGVAVILEELLGLTR